MLIVDGLVVSRWDRTTFEAMQRGGLTAANCTCSVWEGLEETLRNIAQWKRMFIEHADLITPVHDVGDIPRARDEGRVGIILGWQNTTGFGDYLPHVRVFHELGVRVAQLTYNTANAVGFGCYESHDGGLTDYGRELVHEMNDVGMLIDLSHVGERTAQDAIEASRRPVAYTHCCPAALRHHPRNKSDEQLRSIADHGGFVGVAGVPPFMARGLGANVDDYADAIAHVVDVVGADRVGIGTDHIQGQEQAFFDWIASDKGYGRRLVDMGGIPILGGLETLGDYGNLVVALERKRLPGGLIEKIMGENWVRFLGEVWAPASETR
ncbi:MAG: dipeptidase [Acidisphaera sp.]|nr:dipeptidase [Acidisphaera sp.]